MATINDLGMPNPISVSFGGTGVATNATPYGVICAGTTGTNPLQNIASVGTLNQLLTSNGPGALPNFQTHGGGGIVPNYTAPTAFTPVLFINGSSAGISYSAQSGFWMKIGQLVYYSFHIALTNKGTQTSVSAVIHTDTMPIGINNSISTMGNGFMLAGNLNIANSFIYAGIVNFNGFSGGAVPSPFLQITYETLNTGQTGINSMPGAYLTNTSFFYGSGYYYSAS